MPSYFTLHSSVSTTCNGSVNYKQFSNSTGCRV